jgi:subtilisin family serine protease
LALTAVGYAQLLATPDFNNNGEIIMKQRHGWLVGVIASLISIQVLAAVPGQGKVPGQYIIMLHDDAEPLAAAQALAHAHELGLLHVYEYAIRGFAAVVPPGRLAALQRDPRVRSVTADRFVQALPKPCATPPCKGNGGGGDEPPPPSGQTVPTGVSRINGTSSSTAAGDGSGSVNVGVAVIDTGIDVDHADLNVAGGINCSKGRSDKYNDGNGHGTHVAGTIGALDNGTGVVGVAPGVRLYAVRVLNNAGSGFTSDVICGIDWVTANAAVHGISVANMSLGGPGGDSVCGTAVDPEHEAICSLVNAGVTVAVAAGNDAEDANGSTPASYDEVITVSALADFDGAAGAIGSPTCRNDEDDTFANFSNFGADVDIIAPGVCIESTWNDGGYNTISGTSMASPHVAGAAALYLVNNPGLSPAQVRSALAAAGNYNWNNSDDPDGSQEPLLDVGTF